MFGGNTNSPFGGGAFGQQQNTSNAFGSPPAAAPGGLFGAPAPAPFGASSSAPFGTGGGGGFGAAPSAATRFGAPAPSGGLFGAPAPAPAFGGGAFGAPAPASGGLFGAPAPGPAFGSSAPSGSIFGQPSTTNTSNSIFGSAMSTSTFGSAPTPGPFGTASTGGGGGGGLFGAPAPAPGGSLFGSSAPAPAPFGAPAPAAPFGSTFGAPATSGPFGAPAPAPTTGLFGAPPSTGGGLFGAAPSTTAPAAAGTRQIPYQVTSKQDGSATINFESITAMPQYENKSFEELRMEDYAQGNRGSAGSTPTAANTGGFFGAPAPAPTGGLFGAPAPASGGLFGAPAPAPFGAAPAPSTSLFGAPAPATSFGAFGSPSPAPAFGAAPTQAFGASSAPAFGAPAPSGSLFGAPAPSAFGAPSSGGLFGAPSSGAFGAPAPATSSLFGQPAPAPAFGAPAPAMGGGGLFGAPAPGGFGSSGGAFFGASAPAHGGFGAPATGGLFGAPAPSPFGAAQSSGNFFGGMAPAPGGYITSPPAMQHAMPMAGGPILPPNAQIIPPAASQMMQQQMAQLEAMQEKFEKNRAWEPDRRPGQNTTPTSLSGTSASFFSSPPPYAISSASMLANTSSPPSGSQLRPRGFPSSASAKKKPAAQLADVGRAGSLSGQSLMRSPVMQLTVKPNSLSKPRLRFGGLLSNGETLTSPPNENLTNNTHADLRSQSSPSLTPLAGNHTTTPAGIRRASPQAAEASPKTTPAARAMFSDAIVDPIDSVPPDSPAAPQTATAGGGSSLAPKLTLPGYETTPSIEELSKMSEADLACVSNFTVRRKGFGEVAWEGAVDVRGVDLDSTISIEPKDVAVYFREEEDGTKPPVGYKLNRPAVITYLEVFPRNDNSAPREEMEKFEVRLRKQTQRLGADFLSYSHSDGTWKIRVDHFSRYGLLGDDDDDDDDDLQVVE